MYIKKTVKTNLFYLFEIINEINHGSIPYSTFLLDIRCIFHDVDCSFFRYGAHIWDKTITVFKIIWFYENFILYIVYPIPNKIYNHVPTYLVEVVKVSFLF